MLNFSGYTPICGVPLIWDSPKWQNLTRSVTYYHVGGVGGAKNSSNLNIYQVRVPQKKNWSICRPVCSEINFFTQNIGMFDWFGHLNISVYTHHRVTWYSSSSEYRTKRCGHHHDPCDFSITLWSFGRIARKIVKGIILAASDCRIYF